MKQLNETNDLKISLKLSSSLETILTTKYSAPGYTSNISSVQLLPFNAKHCNMLSK